MYVEFLVVFRSFVASLAGLAAPLLQVLVLAEALAEFAWTVLRVVLAGCNDKNKAPITQAIFYFTLVAVTCSRCL